MLAAHRFEIAPQPPAIDVAGEDLASGSTTWTALPDLGETTFSAADSRRELDYMHARYFSPTTARFLSTDPVGGNPRKPQSWNRYAYTRGNPLKFTDPDGRSILHYIRAKWALAASNAMQSDAAVAVGVAADFTPVVGDGKAIYEAYKNPTALNITSAAIGLVPALGDAVGKGLKIGGNILESAAKGARGEAAARAALEIGEKTSIQAGGRTLFPDGLTQTTLNEIKNVGYQGWTRQLRDYSSFARDSSREFNLIIDQDAILSRPLQDAAARGDVNIIPWDLP